MVRQAVLLQPKEVHGGAEIPLQPLEKTMVRQAVPLQPKEVHGGAEIPLQPMEDPRPEHVETPEGGCDPMGRVLAGPVAPWREEPTAEQVDLLVPTKITGIITQGAKDFGHVQFVGSYKIAYSNDGKHWIIYRDEKQKKDKVFQGNFDNDTHRKNMIDPPIYARHVRILPWSWYGRITLRSELLGCTLED
ncbi:EGF-like repeat and discoidin I-like domain-containing protein 3 [Grus japonensis]|uniref:EGF-like repeat and discoidin I-like domain-containing protein 3 n=1 Tax=Grus japonensis TaxID=30415 RepID=A0ABC9Y7J7_GRUJA